MLLTFSVLPSIGTNSNYAISPVPLYGFIFTSNKNQVTWPISKWRYDTQHNDIQHNDIQHNDTQQQRPILRL